MFLTRGSVEVDRAGEKGKGARGGEERGGESLFYLHKSVPVILSMRDLRSSLGPTPGRQRRQDIDRQDETLTSRMHNSSM